MTKQEMKNEAIARMRMLKIYSNAIVYVWNKTFDYQSESGYIRVKPQFGGLIRTC